MSKTNSVYVSILWVSLNHQNSNTLWLDAPLTRSPSLRSMALSQAYRCYRDPKFSPTFWLGWALCPTLCNARGECVVINRIHPAESPIVIHHRSIGRPGALKHHPLLLHRDLRPEVFPLSLNPFDLVPVRTFPHSYTSEPCPTPRSTSGPIILTLQKSHLRCTLGRRPISPEFSSPVSFMVRAKSCST